MTEGQNYGWPCMEGFERTAEYMDQAPYTAACAGGVFATPLPITYRHPVPAPPGNVVSVSAVGGNTANNRL